MMKNFLNLPNFLRLNSNFFLIKTFLFEAFVFIFVTKLVETALPHADFTGDELIRRLS